MNTFKFVLLALCVAAASCDGCWSSRRFFVENNWVIGNGVKASNFYKTLKGFYLDRYGRSTRKGEPGDENCYIEAINFMKNPANSSRPQLKESVVADLGSLFTNYLNKRRYEKNGRSSKFALSHYPFDSDPSKRASIFANGDVGVGENIAWASNNRPCRWALYAWITDAKQKHRGHRKNMYNSSYKYNGLNASGNWYTQQLARGALPIGSRYNKDWKSFGILKKFEGTVASSGELSKWDVTKY